MGSLIKQQPSWKGKDIIFPNKCTDQMQMKMAKEESCFLNLGRG